MRVVLWDEFCIWAIPQVNAADVGWDLATNDICDFIGLFLVNWAKVTNQNRVRLLVYTLSLSSLHNL